MAASRPTSKAYRKQNTRLSPVILTGLVLLELFSLFAVFPGTPTTALAQEAGQPCNQAAPGVFISQSLNLEHSAVNWGVYCEGTVNWTKDNVQSGVEALRCAINGGNPYSNGHCYRNLPIISNATEFSLSTDFQFSPTTCANQGGASVVQAVEFTMNKWQQGKRYEFAVQYMNVGSRPAQWRYWAVSSTGAASWQSFSQPITMCLTGNTWHTLTLTGSIVQGSVVYRTFSVDGTAYPISVPVQAAASAGSGEWMAVGVQLDGNYRESPYEMLIRNTNFFATPA